jgi:hypothetical protein
LVSVATHRIKSDRYLKKSLHSNSNINQFVPTSDGPPPFLGVDPFGIVLGTRKFVNIQYKFNSNAVMNLFSNLEYLVACFFNSSYKNLGERHPVASHGEILQEKLAP